MAGGSGLLIRASLMVGVYYGVATPRGGKGIEPRWGPSQLSSFAKCMAPAVTNRSLVTDQESPSQVIYSAGTGNFMTMGGGGELAGW